MSSHFLVFDFSLTFSFSPNFGKSGVSVFPFLNLSFRAFPCVRAARDLWGLILNRLILEVQARFHWQGVGCCPRLCSLSDLYSCFRALRVELVSVGVDLQHVWLVCSSRTCSETVICCFCPLILSPVILVLTLWQFGCETYAQKGRDGVVHSFSLSDQFWCNPFLLSGI